MGQPSYDEKTLSAYFQPVSQELFEDPIIGDLLRRLASEDPDLVAAVADVDRSQLRDAASLSPLDRVRNATARWNALARRRA